MRSAPPNLAEIRNVYVDESSQTKHRFLVLGSVVVAAADAQALNEALAKARIPELPRSELKWTKVSRTKLAAYKRYVDTFFTGVSDFGVLDFHSIVVDMSRINDRLYNQGSRDIGFNKEMYQLLMKVGRLYRSGVFHVYPDRRSTTQSTEDLRRILNRGRAAKGDTRDWPFRRVHFRDSEKEPVLQVVDLFIGAIAFRLNGHDRAPDASPAKLELSNYILERARVADVTRDTFVMGRFTIWHRQLRPG